MLLTVPTPNKGSKRMQRSPFLVTANSHSPVLSTAPETVSINTELGLILDKKGNGMWSFWQEVVSHLAAFSQPGLLSALKPGHLRAGSPQGLGWGSLLSPSGALRQVRGLWGSWGQPWAGGLSILGSPAPAPAPTTRPTDFGSAGTKPGCWTL